MANYLMCFELIEYVEDIIYSMFEFSEEAINCVSG
ncbi:hypothetical protein HALLA_01370 (plasmid) [Halostagnicola larsenii XH-48]|uniref:Uncharacterized protein n=1 Tax=Halostagnicola larsenii XH-48 TaxID=797299 RepID=W0JXF3_9EURY|nr:hypothetical protein HALLA_01370 [Halostagnicola larsenii XH-48]